jgi:UDP-glucose 4-epimerase
MNILVTGGSGFIGSNLSDYLVNRGHTVTVVDDLSTGYISNLSSVIDGISFYEEKIEFFDFDKLPKIDVLVHLAAQPSVSISVAKFGSSSSSNMLGTIKVIDYCRVNQVPLVYASSSAVYGNLELGDDRNSRVDLLTPYATDKYAMELYAKTAYKLYQLSSIGLRFFNVYGPRQDPNNPYSGVISTFVDRLLRRESITINGGYQTRDFIYVKDVVDIIFKSIVVASNTTLCEQINVLTGQSVTIDELANMLIKKIGVDVDKKYQGLPLGDPEQSNGTTKKMVGLLKADLSDMAPIDSGLSETVNFMRGQA